MNRMMKLSVFLIVFAIVFTGGFVLTGARATECSIVTTLNAPGAGDAEFLFMGFENGPFTFTIMDGGSAGTFFDIPDKVVITELPQHGYRFQSIECEAQPGIIVTQILNGWTIQCVDVEQGAATCIINNVKIETNVPTLSEWGMIATAAGLGLVGLFFALRRRRAFSA